MIKYVFTMKSQELRGASSLNTVQILLASDEDAELFRTNLEACFAVQVVSVDRVISEDYAGPYPAGSDWQARVALWTDDSETYQVRLKDLKTPFDAIGFSTDILAAGIMVPVGAGAVGATRANAYAIET